MIYVTSDIHSYYSILARELDERGFDKERDTLLILGDVFDRGQEAVALLEFLKGINIIYVRGNHEDLIVECVGQLCRDEPIPLHHITNGTLETISKITSIGISELLENAYDREQFDDKIKPLLDFIATSIDYYEKDDYIFVHGWIPLKDGEYCDNWRSGDWARARWANPIANRTTNRTGKTIVCGHWYSCLAHEQLGGEEHLSNFEPYYGDGFIMIDSAVQYSKKLNIVKLDKE